MKDMKMSHKLKGEIMSFRFTEGFATFPLPTNSPNNQICPHFPHEQLVEDQFGTLQGGRLSSRSWVRLRANRKTWTASFYCGQLWMVLRGDNSWKFIWQVSVFQVVPTFPKKGKPFYTYLGGEKINHTGWKCALMHWMVFILTKSDKQLRLLWLLLLSSHVNHELEFGRKQFMLNLSQWVEPSFHSSFFRWFPFPFPILRKYLPGSLN